MTQQNNVSKMTQTKGKCIDAVYDYLISDDMDDLPDLTKNTKEDWVLQNEFEIMEHKEEIQTDWFDFD